MLATAGHLVTLIVKTNLHYTYKSGSDWQRALTSSGDLSLSSLISEWAFRASALRPVSKIKSKSDSPLWSANLMAASLTQFPASSLQLTLLCLQTQTKNIFIPHLEMRACNWMKSRHVTFIKSQYCPHQLFLLA